MAEYLLLVVAELNKYPSLTEDDAATITRAFQLLQDEWHLPYNEDEFAARLEITIKKLRAGFEELYAMTIPQYIAAKRLQAAENLLLYTEKSLQEIASELGYPSTHGLYVAFKFHYRTPPEEFRKRHRTLAAAQTND